MFCVIRENKLSLFKCNTEIKLILGLTTFYLFSTYNTMDYNFFQEFLSSSEAKHTYEKGVVISGEKKNRARVEEISQRCKINEELF